MCLTLPETLITVMGIEKVVPRWRDLGVLLQLLPRSSTGERMNPYTSLWTGVRAGRRAARLPPRPARRRPHARARRPGGTAGAALHPLQRLPQHLPGLQARPAGTPTTRSTPARSARSCSRSSPARRGRPRTLPFASSLCGACYEVCPVKIDIPRILVHERAKAVRGGGAGPRGRRPALPRPRVRRAPALRARAAARPRAPATGGPGRARALVRRPAAGLGGIARAARATRADVPRVVGAA